MSQKNKTGDTEAEQGKHQQAGKLPQLNMTIDELWEKLISYQGYTFYTSKGLDFTYTVKGNEIFFSRKEKSVTRASVEIGLRKAIELEGNVSGPKKLICHGSSYLYPVFVWLGLARGKVLKEPVRIQGDEK